MKKNIKNTKNKLKILAMSGGSGDKWSAQADLYSNQAARLTELHGADLITILKDEILKAKTILDVGCGTGAFAKAYLQQFPKGVPGQTLILSDLSAGMLEKAKETVKPGPGFLTKIVFQEEDGTKLEGIPDSSVDLVVSLFGVFLIPDQEKTLASIQRVLKKGDESTFANASWRFGISDDLASQGFGVSLQDVFSVPNDVISPGQSPDFKKWATEEGIKAMFADKTKAIELYQAVHTTVWEFENLWTMLAANPMSSLNGASEADTARARHALEAFVTKDGSSLDKPLTFTSASILCITKGFAASK